MGFFGGKTTYVSSAIYNMAGDREERIDFLKTLTVSSVIGSRNFSMADNINGAYLGGPGIKARSFHRWAKKNYTKIGVPTLNLESKSTLDLAVIGAEIPRDPGQIVEVTFMKSGGAIASYWAEQWIMLNRIADIALEWYSAYSDITGQVTIFWPDATTTVITPAGFDIEARYIYLIYALKTPSSFLGSRVFIYKLGSGNAFFDGLTDTSTDSGTVLPFLPVRIKNKFLSKTNQPEAYALVQKAYTKATGKRGKKGLDELIGKIKENESIDDIDHAYMVYSVSLNCFDNSAKKYLFKFFDFLRTAQPYSNTSVTEWEEQLALFEAESAAFQTSREALTEAERGGPTDPAVTGPIPVAPPSPASTIRVINSGTFDTKLEQEISWKSIQKVNGIGKRKPGAKKGELYWANTIHVGSAQPVNFLGQSVQLSEDRSTVELIWQKTDDSWQSIKIVGMVYENLVYDGNAVTISAAEALDDDEESGFIVPIHYETIKKMSLVDSTQMMTAGTLLVFNSYTVVKQKWYQTGFFKLIVIIIIIAITILTMGTGTAPAVGIFGTAMAVGTAVGLTGVLALIVGTIINTLAAMILVSLIGKVAVAVFGPKIGAIIAMVAAIIVMNVGSAINSGASMAAMWGNMMSAANILQLTSALGSGVAGYVQASTMETLGKMQEMTAEFEKRSKEINSMMIKEFGNGDFQFNPLNLTNVNFGGVSESPSMFLDRTLMTGSDIAEMTVDMLHGFVDATTSVDTIAR